MSKMPCTVNSSDGAFRLDWSMSDGPNEMAQSTKGKPLFDAGAGGPVSHSGNLRRCYSGFERSAVARLPELFELLVYERRLLLFRRFVASTRARGIAISTKSR